MAAKSTSSKRQEASALVDFTIVLNHPREGHKGVLKHERGLPAVLPVHWDGDVNVPPLAVVKVYCAEFPYVKVKAVAKAERSCV